MSNADNVEPVKSFRQAPEEANVSILDDILKERDSRKAELDIDENPIKPPIKDIKEEKEQKVKKTIDDEAEEASKPSEKKHSDDKVSNKTEPKEDEDDEREVEIAKIKKALNDSQKWGHSNNKRLKSVVKIVDSLKDQGILNDDEFNSLSSLLTSDNEPPEIEEAKSITNPLDRFINAANKRLGDLREVFEEDHLFDKKVAAFDFFVNHASEQEKDELVEELESFDINSLKLAKKLFQIGEKYYEENYKELDEAGGLKELVTTKNTEIKRMQRKIDKLEKELSRYSDYDKPTSRIDELGDTPENVSTVEPGNVLGSLIKQRDGNRKR
ncbi:MAG TPA: hypothetical protein PLF17_06095 [Chitinophagaceae bacterium]|nr:hypothetical protein [Chitinophagaceae bacterium]